MTRGFKKIILELIRIDRNFFTLNQVVRTTGLPRENVRDVLIELRFDGFLRRVGRTKDYNGPCRRLDNVRYRVLRPKVLAERIAPKRRGKNNSCDRIWFLIRMKRMFKRKDLRVLAEVSSETVRWFTKLLHRAGIISLIGRDEWSLIGDPGARRPYIGDVIGLKKG